MRDLLKKISLFENLNDDELEEVEKICKTEQIAKDTVIFKEGSQGDKCYVIIKGEVRISKMIPNIGEEALAVLKPGDYFGEMALIDDFPRSAHAIANSDLLLISLSKADLDRILIADREMGYKLLWVFTMTLSRRLRETNEKMAGFLALSSGF